MKTGHYAGPKVLFNAHLETIYPSVFRKVSLRPYERERITTPDDDFLDLDWLKNNSNHLIVISHGLEGNTMRPYMRGMARAFDQVGMDVLTWNYRGCGDELNRQLRFYHSGATDDLGWVVQHALNSGRYHSLSLIGFSLGGNLTLKYLGEQGTHIDPRIKNAVALSVPMELHSSCIQISRPSNWIYAQRFLKSLKEKVIHKATVYPVIDIQPLRHIKTLMAFDDMYTAPLHGFKDAVDYYRQCSALYFLDSIQVPTLILSAKNDPFLSDACYPAEQVAKHSLLQLEIPERGGHVGFTLFNENGLYWSELRAQQFITQR